MFFVQKSLSRLPVGTVSSMSLPDTDGGEKLHPALSSSDHHKMRSE